MGKHFILIHGAWHGGWAWQAVVEQLVAEGHTAEAPTLPGHRPDDDRSGITFQSYVDAIVAILNRQERPVVLVGHSSAGFLLQSVAPHVPHAIERLVFLNAWILPDNTAQFDHVDPAIAGSLRGAAEASPDGCVPVIEGLVREVLMKDDGREIQDAVLDRLTPQPIALFTTPVKTAPFNALSIPRTVLHCRHDTSLPPGTFLAMAEGLGQYDLFEMDGGHETLVTHPERVAAALLDSST